MERFTSLTSLAAPLLEDDVDTDVIFPARYLLLMEKRGLGEYLFHDRRRKEGAVTGEFVLDQPAHRGAQILIAGSNFGCGSSREQAAWALVGAGIRCVIAESFGEIFYANCLKNGLLPIALPADQVARLGAMARQGEVFAADLRTQTIRAGDGPPTSFDIAAERRDALLNGRDEIDEILAARPVLEAFEAQHRQRQPWLFD